VALVILRKLAGDCEVWDRIMNRPTLLIALMVPHLLAAAPQEPRDIVVYGGTSGGIIAAIQAKKSDRSVVLVTPTAYLGGLTTSGLGWTDLGRDTILGGLSRDFYTRLYHHYGDDAAWRWERRDDYGNLGQGVKALNPETKIASTFEPSAATAVFHAMLEEYGVEVVVARLDLKRGVEMEGKRIRAIRTEDGRVFPGRIFIDASYEGDLLPGAGVSFTVGRESNATYGETINGIQTALATKNQLRSGIDPYVVPGDPSSGLLPGVNPDAGGADGEGDHRLQSYCFRMVLTDAPENRVAIEKPADYDEVVYEILFRAIEAGKRDDFTKFDLMPNRKTDSNNVGGISNNPVGWNYGDGMVKNEGDVQIPVPRPYPVSYRAVVPKQGECENLLVPWSLSASHMAFGSIRMEPVFMILAQSSVIAADLCLAHDLSVQALEYEKLRPALLKAGQVLEVD